LRPHGYRYRSPTGGHAAPPPASTRRWCGQTVAFLALAPLIPLIATSLRSKPYYLPGGSFTTDAYRQLLTDAAFHAAAVNTVLFATTATILAVLLGGGFAVLVTRTNLPAARIIGAMVIGPLLIPSLGLIVGWEAIYGPTGYLNPTVGERPAPTSVEPHLHSRDGVPRSRGDPAHHLPDLHRRSAQRRRGVGRRHPRQRRGHRAGATPRHHPVAAPGIGRQRDAHLRFVPGDPWHIPLFLGRPEHISFISSYLYDAWSNGSVPDPPIVSAGSVVLLLAVVAILALRTLLQRHQARYATAVRPAPPSKPLDLGRWRIPAALGVGGFITVTTVIPLLGLVVMSCVTNLTTLVPPWDLRTTANWQALTNDPSLRRAITNSLLVASIGAATTVVLVALATMMAHRSRFPLRRTLPALLVFPRATPRHRVRRRILLAVPYCQRPRPVPAHNHLG